ncbi:MAG: argininosuccinate lyase, partial [Deltaproteobacteria bacterium]|nr:argininosuccinate lyase [Deltaproteobacteria bacterium]
MTVARGGRLSRGIDAAMHELNTSVHVDRELWQEDLAGSRAHVGGLEAASVLDAAEASALRAGLDQVEAEIRSGVMRWDEAREDVHMNIEARLAELVGPVGGKLHTGRSRNDQVATDLRLWT